jgi:threonine dehydratase
MSIRSEKGDCVSQQPIAEPSIVEVFQAQDRIREYLFPFMPRLSETLTQRHGREVWLIPESLQRTGSFKFRGALNRLLTHENEIGGSVITASSGNHAIGMTVAASITGTDSTVVVPEDVSGAKLSTLRALGANVMIMGCGFDQAEDLMFEYAARHGIEIVNSFDPDVIAGHATVALDTFTHLPDLSALLAPVASGGLLAGCSIVARAVSPDCKLIGVQTEAWPAMHASLAASRLVNVSGMNTLADGLAGNADRSALPFQIIQREVAGIELVGEDRIRAAIRHALVNQRLVVEGAGAATLAAGLDGKIPCGSGPVGLILSGGNCTEAALQSALCSESPS